MVKFYCMNDWKMEYLFIIAVSHMSLMCRYVGFTIRFTILKYPRYTCIMVSLIQII